MAHDTLETGNENPPKSSAEMSIGRMYFFDKRDNARMGILLLSLSLLLLFLLGGCGSTKRYKPVVKYSHPSDVALEKILRGTYGRRYRYAGQGPNRFDCSGLVYFSYATMNLWLPRRAIDQARYGKTISAKDLRFGDLVFFDTRRHPKGIVNHVGIYLSHGKFFHASSAKHKVIISSLNKPYYRRRIIAYKRVYSHWRNQTPAPSHRAKSPVQRRASVETSSSGTPTYSQTATYAAKGQAARVDNTTSMTSYSREPVETMEKSTVAYSESTMGDRQNNQSLY